MIRFTIARVVLSRGLDCVETILFGASPDEGRAFVYSSAAVPSQNRSATRV
jgi:hypothetical protein